MTWVFQRASDSQSTLNIKEFTTPNMAGRALFDLKECLKYAGWTCIACGTGTGGSTYTDDTGPRITLALLNGSAGGVWFALQTPTGGKVLVFQKQRTNDPSDQTYWRIKVIPTGGINSDGTATQTPSAVTSSRVGYLMGGGTDASPTFTLYGAVSNYIQQIGADNANGYGFYVAAYAVSTLAQNPAPIVMEAVSSSSVDDIDPCVYFTKGGANSSQWWQQEIAANLKMWRKNTNGVWVFEAGSFGIPVIGSNTNTATACWCCNMSYDRWTSKDQNVPMSYGQRWSAYGGGCFKGWGRNMTLCGTDRGTCSTRTVSTSKDFWQMGHAILPWDGSLTPATT